MNNRVILFIVMLSIIFVFTLTTPDLSHEFKVRGQSVEDFPGIILARFTTALFTGSGNCADCHSDLRDSTEQDVSMDAHWRSTMMANAARDPLWQAKVSSEIARNPQLKDIIEKKCSTCHMPIANTQARADGSSTEIFHSGFVDTKNPLNAAAMDGVSCSLCHQISEKDLGNQASYSGGFDIDTTTAKPARKIYGQFRNPFTNPMIMRSGFVPTYGAHMETSEHCATCHALYTPYLNSKDEIAGEFPEQTPYLEWKFSKYPKQENGSCQGCHMPNAEGSVKLWNRGGGRGGGRTGGVQERKPFAMHHFVGGNALMLNLFKANARKLELTTSTRRLDDTIARTLDLMQNQTATLKIKTLKLANKLLRAKLIIRSKVGHKFPTGIPLRRAWIQLKVTNGIGKTVFSSGNYSSQGRIYGNDADINAAAFEPHYDLITDRSQVQIYEAIMSNTDGEVTYTLLRAAEYVKDNRLLPAGFRKAAADVDIAVYGKALKDADFKGGSDIILYKIDLGSNEGPFKVEAKLLYQSLSFRAFKDLVKVDTKQIRTFTQLYQKTDRTPAVVAEVVKEIS